MAKAETLYDEDPVIDAALTAPTRQIRFGDQAIQLGQFKLLVLQGLQSGREFSLSGDLIRIGKAESNNVIFTDDSVSRFHCEIIRDPRGYLLRDLKSTNGTFIDGCEVKQAYLQAGSLIAIGKARVKFQPFDHRLAIAPSNEERLGLLIGRSSAMRRLFSLLTYVAPTDVTVLIEGETGTGKDLVAHTIHSMSDRAQGPLYVVDCSAVCNSLIESELFGHEQGAFTGAVKARQGALELADGGTLILDEMAELSLDLQPKLLRAIEQREFRRLGGNQLRRTNIRIIATTNRDLKREVQQGKFREDLYFRLAVVPIYLPPLRQRKEDLPLLVNQFLTKIRGENIEIPPPTMEMLSAHDWPGNVRELRNVLERAVYLAQQMGQNAYNHIHLSKQRLKDFTPEQKILAQFNPQQSFRANKDQWNNEFENRYLKWLLMQCNNNVSKAARQARMDRKYFYKLLKKHMLR